VEYSNAGQVDLDDDGVGPPCDCDDENPDTYPGADEVNDGFDNQCVGQWGHGLVDEIEPTTGFHNPADRNEYSWTPQVGTTLYEVARSAVPDFSAGCTPFTTASPYLSDAQAVPSGTVHHYLVRPSSPYTGSWGVDSQGAERAFSCP